MGEAELDTEVVATVVLLIYLDSTKVLPHWFVTYSTFVKALGPESSLLAFTNF